VHPDIRDTAGVFIVDGDMGRINTIRSLLPNFRVFMCLWHKEKNVKTKIGRARGRGPNYSTMSKTLLMAECAKKGLFTEGKKEDLVARLNDAATSAWAAPTATAATSFVPKKDLPEEGDDDEFEVPIALNVTTTEPPKDKKGKTIDRFNQTTAYDIFRWVSSAPSVSATFERLKTLATMYPHLEEYALEDLWRTAPYWARCFRTWMLTFGLDTTALQEGAHASIKSQLGRNVVPLQEVPALLSDVFVRRTKTLELKTDRGKPDFGASRTDLLAHASEVGFSRPSRKAS
jgi:hypothetical protein